ncbi:MAG: hypothetical protein ACTHMJ_17015, partial [Thermomicrobiales bacterium]
IDIRPVTGGDATQIVAHNEHDATVAIGEHGLEVLLAPEWYLPTNGTTAPYAPPWATWFQSPDAPGASEPPAIAQRQMALYRQLQATPDVAQQHALMMQILDLAADAFYAIGISLHPSGYGMVKNTLHNVPAAMLSSPLFEEPAPLNTCLFYQDTGARSGETAAVLQSGKTSGNDVAPTPRPGSSQARA